MRPKSKALRLKSEMQCVAQIKMIAQHKTLSEMERTLSLSRRSIRRIIQDGPILCLRDPFLRNAVNAMFQALPRKSPSTDKVIPVPKSAKAPDVAKDAEVQNENALTPSQDMAVKDLDALLCGVPYFDVFVLSSARIEVNGLQDLDANVRGLARKHRMKFSDEEDAGIAMVFGLRQKLFDASSPTTATALETLNTLSVTVPCALLKKCSVQDVIDVLRMAAREEMVRFLNVVERESVLVRGAEQNALFRIVSNAWIAMRNENAIMVDRDYSLAVIGAGVPHDAWPGTFKHRVGYSLQKALRSLATIA
mgnify:CR=1 FL=1